MSKTIRKNVECLIWLIYPHSGCSSQCPVCKYQHLYENKLYSNHTVCWNITWCQGSLYVFILFVYSIPYIKFGLTLFVYKCYQLFFQNLLTNKVVKNNTIIYISYLCIVNIYFNHRFSISVDIYSLLLY